MIYETRQLEEVNEAFDEVESGRVSARLVFDFAGGTSQTGQASAADMVGERPKPLPVVPSPEQPTGTERGETGPIPG